MHAGEAALRTAAMRFDLSALWAKAQAMIDGFFALLPNLAIESGRQTRPSSAA